MDLAYQSSEKNPVVELFLADSCGGSAGLILDIHADDAMYGYFLACESQRHRERALLSYYRSGWSACRTIMALRDAPTGPGPKARILDFASGFGRSTRFLAREHDPSLITVSDVLADAIEFQRQALGLEGVVSSIEPESFELAGRFDLIFVGSLFSHLPESRFLRWVRRLAALLAPGGWLAFTTHDVSLILPGRVMPAAGIYFEPMSELGDRIDLEDYGSTWVEPHFVETAIHHAFERTVPHRLFPKGAWSYQDLWLVAPDAGSGDLARVIPPLEPRVFVEEVVRRSPTELEVRGWAADLTDPRPPQIELSVGGEMVATTFPDSMRVDVATALGLGPRRLLGFRIVYRASRTLASDELVGLAATSEEGVRYLAHLDTIASSELYSRLLARTYEFEAQGAILRELELSAAATAAELAAREGELVALTAALEARAVELAGRMHQLHDLQTHVATMEASRFWKLREWWWRVRGTFGVGDRAPRVLPSRLEP